MPIFTTHEYLQIPYIHVCLCNIYTCVTRAQGQKHIHNIPSEVALGFLDLFLFQVFLSVEEQMPAKKSHLI